MEAAPKQEQRSAASLAELNAIHDLASTDANRRATAAHNLFYAGIARLHDWLAACEEDEAFSSLVVREEGTGAANAALPRFTVGVAVLPDNFEPTRVANGSPRLADAPSDQDVLEFELDFPDQNGGHVRLDVLTTSGLARGGAVDRFLAKFGEAVQQVEIDVADVDRATEILQTRFHLAPVFPATRYGANGTRVNFFLVPTGTQKVLVELVQQPTRGATR